VFLVGGLAIVAALAFFLAPRASGEPDGLNKVALDEGFAETETDHALADTPTAGYELGGVDDSGLSTGLAGLIGVAITFAAAGALLLAVRYAFVRRAGASSVSGPPPGAPASSPAPGA
jgi:hypothetical protein